MRISILWLIFAAPAAVAGPLRIDLSAAEGWEAWSPRAEIAPRAFVDPVRGWLAVSGNSLATVHGGWERTVGGIQAGRWYRCTARYRSQGVPAENWQIVARLDWRQAGGKRAGGPDSLYRPYREGEWTRLAVDAPAPKDATAVKVQLFLSNAPLGTVWWKDIVLEEIPAPPPRPVTVAAVNLMPSRTGSPSESVRQFVEMVEREVPASADLIVLPEGITVVGTGKSYVEVAEPIPGPTTTALSQLARKRRAWVVAGIYEREAGAAYNTAVLLDREGRVAGKYRKVYLPYPEVEAGLTPGDSFPVFQTDFGTIGMMICYDVFYADPARALALRGAEIVVLPIWGGPEPLAKARAIEGRVFLVASGYNHPTYIMDPEGEKVASAGRRGTAAVATIDLNRRYPHVSGGDLKNRRPREIRLDIALDDGK